MKKLIALLIAIMMVLSLAACGSNEGTNTETQTQEKTEATTAAPVTESPTTEAPTTEEPTTEVPTTEPEKISKEELLSVAIPLMNDEAKKMFNSPAYVSTLIGNTYTFTGKVYELSMDYIDVALERIEDENGKLYGYDYWNLSVHVYLPIDELINITYNDIVSIVGKITGVEEKSTDYPGGGVIKGTVIVMQDAYLNN